MRKLRILFCINNLKIGGAEKLLIDLINNWPENYDIHLILFSKSKNDLLNLLDRNRLINIYYLSENTNEYSNILKVRKYLKLNKIDYCFSHLEKPNKVCLIASIFTKTKVFPVVHSINIYENSTALSFIVASFIYRFFAKKVIVISEAVKKYCENSLRINWKNIIQINNGIDFNRIRRYSRTIIFNKEIKFAVLGRMERVKGYDILLEVLSDIRLKRLNWKLKMIGDGSEMTNLKKIALKGGIIDKVEFLGAKKKPIKFLSDVHFLVMPSRREGLPISLLESLGFGIPVIVSDVGVLPDIVTDNKNGFVFKTEDSEMLLHKIDYCLNIDPEKYNNLSSNAKKSVVNYSIKECVAKYINVIKSL